MGEKFQVRTPSDEPDPTVTTEVKKGKVKDPAEEKRVVETPGETVTTVETQDK